MVKSDNEVINKLIAGDESAYRYIYSSYYPELCIYAKKFVETIEDAEEIVQEVIFKIWAKRETLSAINKLKPYLYKSVHNGCLNYIKHLKIRENYKNEMWIKLKEIELENSESLIMKELEQELSNAIKSLPEQCRKVFEMSRNEDLKYSEIAKKLDITTKAVEANISRALAHLRKKLKNYLTFIILVFLLLKNSIF